MMIAGVGSLKDKGGRECQAGAQHLNLDFVATICPPFKAVLLQLPPTWQAVNLCSRSAL